MFEAVVNEIANRINEVEFNPVNKPYSTREKYTKPRTRNRKSVDQERFLFAVSHILTDLFMANHSVPKRYCKIHLGRDHYNNTSKYSNPKLGYEAICDASVHVCCIVNLTGATKWIDY